MEERMDRREETQNQDHEQEPAKYSLGGGLGAFLAMGAVDLFAHLGPTGLVVAAIVGVATYRHAHEVIGQIGKEVPLPKWTPKPDNEKEPGSLPLWQRALGLQAPQEVTSSRRESVTVPHLDASEIFAEQVEEEDQNAIERITVEQAVAHTTPNSYKVFVGRSLTDEIGRARQIDFRGKHLKFIGASQRGKSSEVAALLTQITETHTPDAVQFAILDLEDRTGRLFADVPHIKRIRVDGTEVRLHARNVDQVLEHLVYITKFMDVRYKLPQSELERQPILLVYIEEFLRLRRTLKSRITTASPGSARDKAQRDYTRLLECIDALAARGLKARIQLWLCAQVDYVDPDLRDALANVIEGFSFCVKPTAAQAAGFTRADYLARNHSQKRVGQAVIETTDLTDIIAAVEFPLATRLRELDAIHRIHYSPSQGHIEHEDDRVNVNNENAVNSVNAPVKLVNATVNVGEYSQWPENVSPTFTAAEETQVLLAYAELLKAGKSVTRTGIRDELQWDNKQYTRIIKPVCDKHNIG